MTSRGLASRSVLKSRPRLGSTRGAAEDCQRQPAAARLEALDGPARPRLQLPPPPRLQQVGARPAEESLIPAPPAVRRAARALHGACWNPWRGAVWFVLLLYGAVEGPRWGAVTQDPAESSVFPDDCQE